MQLNPEFSPGEHAPNEIIPESTGTPFSLGQVVATSNATLTLSPADIMAALARHQAGDWGDLDPEDWATNEQALKDGGRLFSVYHTSAGTRLYVITEWTRELTTVLLPEDY